MAEKVGEVIKLFSIFVRCISDEHKNTIITCLKQNTDYNNLNLQLGGLYCDAMYYMDLVSDCFAIDVAEARKELIDLLQRDKRFSSVDPEIFTRFDQS